MYTDEMMTIFHSSSHFYDNKSTQQNHREVMGVGEGFDQFVAMTLSSRQRSLGFL